VRGNKLAVLGEARHYIELGREFEAHGAVNHGQEEYVRGEISTNRLKASIRSSSAA
jgi:hypothetical protein